MEVRNLIKDNIILETEDSKSFDKMKIALAIRNSTFGDELNCSILENAVINNCEGCSLKFICERVDEVAEKYLESTTKLVSSFDFSEETKKNEN